MESNLIFIVRPVNADTPPTAKQTKNLPINSYLTHIELTKDGETGLPLIIGEEDSAMLTNPAVVASVEKLAFADELIEAALEDIANG